MKRTMFPLAAVLALVLAACGTDQTAETPSPSPSLTVEPTPVATPSPTEEPTAEPTDDGGTGSGAGGSLLAVLPEEVGGLPRQEVPGLEQMIAPALEQQGLDADNVDVAFAMWGQGELVVTGFQIEGIEQSQLEMLLPMLSGGQIGGQADVEAETVTVGGKEVLRMTGADVPDAAYVYIADDAFFTVISESAELAEELLSQLP